MKVANKDSYATQCKSANLNPKVNAYSNDNTRILHSYLVAVKYKMMNETEPLETLQLYVKKI